MRQKVDDMNRQSGKFLIILLCAAITSINESGISGSGENGTAVNAGYDEIFQIEVTKKSFAIKSDGPALTGAGKAVGVAIEGVAKAGLVALCITAAAGGIPCL